MKKRIKQRFMCPDCATFMDELPDRLFKCPSCSYQLQILIGDNIQEDWKWRFCSRQTGSIVNIATVNLKTGGIGRIKIPEKNFADPNYHFGKTMEDVIEKFG